MWILSIATLVVGVFVPVAIAKKFALVFSIFFSMLLLFPLVAIFADAINITVVPDCEEDGIPAGMLPLSGPKADDAEDVCNAAKLVLVASFLLWWAQSLQVAVSILLLSDNEESKS